MEPDLIPLYVQADLARYLRLPASTIAYWRSRGRRAPHAHGALLSFEELISLLFVRELRDHKVSFKDIFLAERDLTRRLEKEHPFAWEPLWVEGRDILVKTNEPEGYLSPNRAGQQTLPDLVEPQPVRLSDILEPLRAEVDYAGRKAVAWRPALHVVARPAVQFGLPCLESTRIPTRTLLRAVLSGDPIEEVAGAYGVPVVQIQAAVGWERTLAA